MKPQEQGVENLRPEPAAYRYDLPEKFRNQFFHILKDVFGYSNGPLRRQVPLGDYQAVATMAIYEVYGGICEELCEHLGVLSLPGIEPPTTPLAAFWSYFQTAGTEQALRAIEIAIENIPKSRQNVNFVLHVYPTISKDEAVRRLNERFRENAVGYRMEGDRVVRLDSDFLHAETTEPTFRLLYQHGFDGAIEEFRLAHKRFREGPEHYDDCLTNCLKALESTLKTICNRRKWAYDPNDTASKLLDIIFRNNLIPSYLQTHFAGLRSTLEAGVPTIRNREGGHGSGEKPNEVPEHLAAYQLHLTASAIVLLIRASGALGK
ncbi:MAG TPA: hypothetical protein VLZ50_15730 [Terracidiphilus sp.]|nr:hypothetical protein [Terracidiphilus sp.]